MKKEYTEAEARYKVEAFCSASEHCCAEVVAKLERMEIPYDMQQRIVEHLIKEKYIDESRFAKAFVRDKYRFNKWGRVKIIQALKLKKISREAISVGLEEIACNDYDENLMSLIKQKNRSVKASSDYERRGKLIRFALGRGFEMNVVIKTLDKMGFDEEIPE